jgi:CP family cyanate transporter-like MFS transporter
MQGCRCLIACLISLETSVKNFVPARGDEQVTKTWRMIIACVLLALLGINLRSVILAVPPILPLLQHDLSLSYTETGLLTAFPILMFGAAGWLSGLLVGRIGGRLAVTIGLTLLAIGALLRVALPSIFFLYLFTIILSLGIALAQTSAPVLARAWFPNRIGLVTALFTDGLIIGEALGAGITVPIMTSFLGADAWKATFLLWGLPVVVMLVLWFLLAPRGSTKTASVTTNIPIPSIETATTAISANDAIPVKRARVSALHMGIILGSGSLIYFGMNSWIAPYNLAIHHAGYTPLTLTLLNLCQLPASLTITFFAQQLAGRRWPFILAGFVCILSLAGWIFTPVILEPFWAILLGAASAVVFTLGLSLPPLLAEPGNVAKLTGITLSISYTTAFIGPFVGGGLWDILHLPPVAFLPVAAACITLIVLGSMLPSRENFGLYVHGASSEEKKPDAAAIQ